MLRGALLVIFKSLLYQLRHHMRREAGALQCPSIEMEIFSDGVFAIVITLLVLELHPPDVQHLTFSALSSVAPNVFAFVLSFVIVAMYWIAHHNMGLCL